MNKPLIRKDVAKKTITVERTFAAPRARVWEAWTKSELLEKWWAPKPWIAVTKTFDFREGGHWHYYMQGPDGTKAWCWIGYETIDAENSFTARDAFCDENAVLAEGGPNMHWLNVFQDQGEATHVTATITFASEADMEKIIAMGFEEGFSMGLGNLDELLAS
ncbi:SRPBCC domain-containing protein [Patescibacteria group bacterium]|nr:SRPBCC domain-containing protein [Patescibacteria group bacterium]